MIRAIVDRRVVASGIAALALLGGGCGEDDRPATWSYVHAAIIAPSCTSPGCHNDETAVAGVRLGDREGAYAILVGRPCDGTPPPGAAPRNYVDPGSPERSTLVYLLRGEGRAIAMPPDRLLPYRDVALVEDWIAEGAPCD
jgi:hypothetical protein